MEKSDKVFLDKNHKVESIEITDDDLLGLEQIEEFMQEIKGIDL